MAIPHGLEATVLPDISVSWSNRNGGELLLIGGSVRMVVSAAWAQAVVDKFSRALAVPKLAAEMAARNPAPELERVAAPDTLIGEDLRHRNGALIGALPSKSRRIEAIAAALSDAGQEAEVVMVAGIAFTRVEATLLHDTLFPTFPRGQRAI